MNITLLFIFACYVAPTFAGWHNCEPCRCHRTSYIVIAQCLRSNTPSEHTLHFVPKELNKDIQELQIRGHQIKTLHENNFEHYHKLEILDVSKNRITEVKNHAFKNLIKLKELTLVDNELSTLPTTIFRDTPNLTCVSLNNNKFTTLQKDLFSNLPHLEDVHIQNNSLLTVQENCFVNVPLLTTINLCRNQLTYISSKTFQNLNNLKTVNLAYNPWNCDTHLCEIMSLTVIQSWDNLSSPICHSPENKNGKSWRNVLNNHTPTIMYSVSKSTEGQNVTLECNVCSKSKIIWINNHQKIFEDNEGLINDHSTTSLLTLSGVSDNNNGEYSCRVKDCVKCDEDALSLHVNKNSLEMLRQMKNLKVGSVKLRKSIEEIVAPTKANDITSTTISTTFKTIEVTTIPVTEQNSAATALKYINMKDETESEASEIGTKGLQEFLAFYIISPSLIIITLLIVVLIVLWYRRKYKTLKQKYKETLPHKKAETEPLQNENSNRTHGPTPPPSTHQSSQTEMIISKEPTNNNTYFDETNQSNNYEASRDYNGHHRIGIHRSNSNYSEDNNSTWGSSSERYRTMTLENERSCRQMLTRIDSGYGSNDNNANFVLNMGRSFYNDETPD